MNLAKSLVPKQENTRNKIKLVIMVDLEEPGPSWENKCNAKGQGSATESK